MRISVNLASRPFVELRPLLARLRLAMAGLALLAIALGFGLHALTAKARHAQAQMDALKQKTAAYQHELTANEVRMGEPQNRAVLERAQFLNELFTKKSFSWTAVMMDLETVLPGGVQVTSIDPSLTKQGDVNIRLRVSGDRDKAVQLVRNLEGSRRFLNPRLSGEALQAPAGGNTAAQRAAAEAAGSGVEFDILSGYNPLSSRSMEQDETASKSSKHSSKPSQAAAGLQPGSTAPAPRRAGMRTTGKPTTAKRSPATVGGAK